MVTQAVSATSATFATTSGFALSFNTGTLVTQAVSATSLVSGTWTFAVSSTGSVTLNGVPFVSSGASTGTTTTFVISNITQSTGTNSGALQVVGGVGVGGSLNVGNTSVFNVNSTSDALRITQTGAGNALVVEDEASPDSSPFVIASNGTMIIGHTSRITQANLAEVHGSATINSYPAIGVYSWGTLATGGGLNLYKSRSGTVGTYSTATNGSQSSVRFQFDDGAAFQQAASIIGSAEGTPAINSMPGRLTFATTPDASVTPLERMRIDSTGQTKFSTAITATSTTTGALVVTGGVGIGGNLYVGGSVNLSTSTLTFNNSVNNSVIINNNSTQVFKTDGSSISIGTLAGSNAAFAVAIGIFAGSTNQGLGGIALGEYAGSSNQGQYAIAIGTGAGQNDQPAGSIVLDATWNGSASFTAKNTGTYIAPIRADNSTSATTYGVYYDPVTRELTTSNSVASLIVTSTSSSNSTNSGALQVVGGVGVGGNLYVGGDIYSSSNQVLVAAANFGVAIGTSAGNSATNSIAIGAFSGSTLNNGNSIAIGYYAGAYNQGAYSIAIGQNAGASNQPARSIIIDATSDYPTAAFTAKNTGTYIAPIRADNSTSATTYGVYYNPVTRELTTSNSVASLIVTSTSSSNSTNSGALQVVGGVGVGGNLYVGKNFVLPSSSATFAVGIAAPSQTGYPSIAHISGGNLKINSGSYYLWDGDYPTFIAGASGTTGNSYIEFNPGNAGTPLRVEYGGITKVQNTTQSYGTNSGALQVVGGVGIGGDLYVGGTSIKAAQNPGQTGAGLSLSTYYGNLNIQSGYGTYYNPSNNVNIIGGDADSGYRGGSIYLTPGSGSYNNEGPDVLSGNVGITGGTGNGVSAGDVTITGGYGTGDSGNVYIGSKISRPNGSIYIAAGNTSTGKNAQLNVTGYDGVIAASANQITLVSTATTGTINNMSIGATTAATGRFTTITATNIFVNGYAVSTGTSSGSGSATLPASTASLITSEIIWSIDGGGFIPNIGDKAVMQVPFNCYVTQATVIGNSTGSALIYVSTSSVASWPGRTLISTSTINLVNTQTLQISTASWTNTTLSANTMIVASLQTVNTFTFLTLSLKVTKL